MIKIRFQRIIPKIITKYGNVEQQWRHGYVKQCENKSSVYEADPDVCAHAHWGSEMSGC